MLHIVNKNDIFVVNMQQNEFKENSSVTKISESI